MSVVSLQELGDLLEKTNLPVAYNHFKTAQNLPFIAYIDTGTDNFIADNKVYHRVIRVNVELYTHVKDSKTEQLLEDLLNNNEVPYNYTGTYFIESEDMYQTIYQITLI